MTALSPHELSIATNHGTTLRSLLEYNRRPLVGYNFIAGIVPSNAADATNDISFTAGACVSNNGNLIPFTATTKRLDAAFGLGINAGGSPNGLTISVATYHCFALWGPSTLKQDAGFDSSLTAANLLADATVAASGLTEYRRIFSFRRLTGPANQVFSAMEVNGGGLLVQIAPVTDFSFDWTGTDDAARTGTSTRIPIGVQHLGRWAVTFGDNSPAARSSFLMSSFDAADVAPVTGGNPFTTSIGQIRLKIDAAEPATNSAEIAVVTRASDAAVRFRATGTTADHGMAAALLNWTDFRVS